jgi:hypothetical protein
MQQNRTLENYSETCLTFHHNKVVALSLHTPTQYYDNSIESRLKLIFTYAAILKGIIYVFSERNIASYHSNMHDFGPKKATNCLVFERRNQPAGGWWSRGAGNKQTERRGMGGKREEERLYTLHTSASLTQHTAHTQHDSCFNIIHVVIL